MSGRFAIQIISKKDHKEVILLNDKYKKEDKTNDK